MRIHAPDVIESDIGRRDQIVHDAHARLAADRQIGIEQQIVIAVNRPRETVLDRRDATVRLPRSDRGEHLVERMARHAGHLRPEETAGGGFTECACFTLIRDLHRFPPENKKARCLFRSGPRFLCDRYLHGHRARSAGAKKREESERGADHVSGDYRTRSAQGRREIFTTETQRISVISVVKD